MYMFMYTPVYANMDIERARSRDGRKRETIIIMT